MNNSSEPAAIPYFPLPPSPYGDQHDLARLAIVLFNSILIIFQLLFLKGAWVLKGWESNFSFTLLIGMSLAAIQHLLVECVAVALSANNTEMWQTLQIMWRFLGSFTCVPNATQQLLSLLLTAQRFVYTAFPFSGARMLTPSWAKAILTFVLLFHVFFCFATTTDVGYYRYVPNLLANSIKAGTALTDVYLNLSIVSDWLIVINPLFYPLIFLLLFCNKSYKVKKGSEIRMTIQALLIMLTEFGCFLYWTRADAQVTDSWIFFLLRTWSMSFYLSCSSIIYLILNKSVRRNAFSFELKGTVMASVSMPTRPTHTANNGLLR